MQDDRYPFLGLGISASASEAAAIATKIVEGQPTHLPALDFLNVGVSTLAPVPEGLAALLAKASLGKVAHLEEINLVGELDEERLARVLERCELLEPSWLQEDLGIWVWKGGALGDQMIAPILDAESLRQATRNITAIGKRSRFPFLAENPPFYCAVGDMDLLDFMAKLADQTGCGLLLDIGHFIGYCTCAKRDALEYLASWKGFDAVVELHLAGYTLRETADGLLWEDAHTAHVQPHALDVLDAVLARARNIKAITVEVEGAQLDVLNENVRRVANRVQPAPAPVEVSRA